MWFVDALLLLPKTIKTRSAVSFFSRLSDKEEILGRTHATPRDCSQSMPRKGISETDCYRRTANWLCHKLEPTAEGLIMNWQTSPGLASVLGLALRKNTLNLDFEASGWWPDQVLTPCQIFCCFSGRNWQKAYPVSDSAQIAESASGSAFSDNRARFSAVFLARGLAAGRCKLLGGTICRVIHQAGARVRRGIANFSNTTNAGAKCSAACKSASVA